MPARVFTIAAKAAHLPSAIDGPTVGSSALKLSEATAVSAEFGMTGKICLTRNAGKSL